MLWPSGPLTLTKKSKLSKRTCLTQFFEYIPILGPISSFEAQKLRKCPVSKSWLLHKYWPKSQNFQEVPILPKFSRRFHFWGLFLHLRIRNCSNSVILQLLVLMWTLTKNQDVRVKLVLFKFSHGFWFLKSTYLFWTWKPPMWPTSPKYQQYPKVKLPRSRFEIHSLNLDSLKVILQTLSKASLPKYK